MICCQYKCCLPEDGPIFQKMERQNTQVVNCWDIPRRNNTKPASNYKTTVLQSNYFKVTLPQISHIYIFKLFITPPVCDNSPILQQITSGIVAEMRTVIRKPVIRGSLVYSHLPPEGELPKMRHEGYSVRMKQVCSFSVKDHPRMLIGFLNNVMKRHMTNLGYIEVGGRSRKYVKVGSRQEKNGLLIFSGYHASIHRLEAGCFLKVDTHCKVVQDETVLSYIDKIYRANSHLDRDSRRARVKSLLVNELVMTNYGRSRYLKVQDVIFGDLRQMVVESYNLTFPEYYLQKYNLIIKNPKQPLLYANSRNTAIKTYLVPEFCLMATNHSNLLNIEAINSTISYCQKNVKEKKAAIHGFIEECIQPGSLLEDLNIRISQQNEQVEARILPAPKIQFGDRKTLQTGLQYSFSLKNQRAFNCSKEIEISVLAFQTCQHFIYENFKTIIEGYGIRGSISLTYIEDGPPQDALDRLQAAVAKAFSKSCSFLVLILPRALRKLYPSIKKLTILQKQIPSQVILQTTFSKKNVHTVNQKIALQIISKAGNALLSSTPRHKTQRVLICAFSIARTANSKLTVSVCSTLDSTFSTYFSKCLAASSLADIYALKLRLLIQALSAYTKANSLPPKDIVVLERNNQQKKSTNTLDYFIKPAITHLYEVYGEGRPCLCYINVKQAINDRYFQEDQGRLDNPNAASVVDKTLTEGSFQFLLFAHSLNNKRGCVIPTKYSVIYSDSNLPDDALQQLLYSQCFSYCNWQGAIKFPASLEYARQCAKFNNKILDNSVVDGLLQTQLYYI